MIQNMPSSTYIVTSVGRRIRSSTTQSMGSFFNRPQYQNCPKWRYDRIQTQSPHYMHAMTKYVSNHPRFMMRWMDFPRCTYNFAPSRMFECECDTTNRQILYRTISDVGRTTSDEKKSTTKTLPVANNMGDDIEISDTVKEYHENSDLLTKPATGSEHSLDFRNSSSYDQTSNPSFKVSRVTYKTGAIETVNLDTATLLKEASVYARDLFFTLNLTSRQERYQQQRVHVNGSGSGKHKNTAPSTSSTSYHNHNVSAARRTVSIIQSRKKKIILLSFGTIRAVAGLHDVLLFDAHSPTVRDFAHELRNSFQSKAINSSNTMSSSSTSDSAYALLLNQGIQNHGSNNSEPYELLFLECVLRDTVDTYHRRLRLFEPIVDSILDKVDKNDITSPDAVVHQIGPLKDALQSFEMQVRQSLECLDHLLTHDDEMLALLLTEQNAAHNSGGTVDFARHEHVELLLGVYARQISNVSMEITYLLQRLQSKQEFVTLALSGYRNRMVQMNVHLSIAALSLGLSTTVAGFFGMNLLHGMESSTLAFGYVVFFSCTSSLLTWMWALNHLSGTKMRRRAKQRLDEMETLTGALSDMCALDHTLKTTIERGGVINKEQFRVLLQNARYSRVVTSNEVDLLFDVFDKIKDGSLSADDFHQNAHLPASSSSWGMLARKTK